MKGCPVNDLILYAFGELDDPQRRAALAEHLSECADCREELQFLRSLARKRARQDLEPPPVPIPNLVPGRATSPVFTFWLRIAAAVLLFLAAGAGIVRWQSAVHRPPAKGTLNEALLLEAKLDSLCSDLLQLDAALLATTLPGPGDELFTSNVLEVSRLSAGLSREISQTLSEVVKTKRQPQWR